MQQALIIFGAEYLIGFLIAGAAAVFGSLSDPEKKTFLRYLFLLAALSYLASFLAAHFYPELRPAFTGPVVPLIETPITNSFPSNHTLLGAVLALLVFRFYPRVGLLFFAVAILIGICRVLAGVHYPVDVIGGMLIPIVLAVLLSFGESLYNKRHGRTS